MFLSMMETSSSFSKGMRGCNCHLGWRTSATMLPLHLSQWTWTSAWVALATAAHLGSIFSQVAIAFFCISFQQYATIIRSTGLSPLVDLLPCSIVLIGCFVASVIYLSWHIGLILSWCSSICIRLNCHEIKRILDTLSERGQNYSHWTEEIDEMQVP